MSSRAKTEIKPGDWFAMGQNFGPYHFKNPHGVTPSAKKFGTDVGVQILVAMDVGSICLLYAQPMEKTPSPFTAAEVLSFLRTVFERHGVPRLGVLLSPSVWQSSHEMMTDDTIGKRALFLKEMEIDLGPMDVCEKDKIVASLKERGLRVEFDEGRLSSR